MRKIVFQAVMAAAVGIFLNQSHAQAQSAHSSAAEVFQANCQMCHGADGAGSDVGKSLHAPDLRSAKVQSQSNATLQHFISEGNGAMPSFKDRLDQKQIAAEVEYIRHLAKHP